MLTLNITINFIDMFVIYFLIPPVANVLMRFGCQSKGTEDFKRLADLGKYSKGMRLFLNLKTISRKSRTRAWLLIVILMN